MIIEDLTIIALDPTGLITQMLGIGDREPIEALESD